VLGVSSGSGARGERAPLGKLCDELMRCGGIVDSAVMYALEDLKRRAGLFAALGQREKLYFALPRNIIHGALISSPAQKQKN